jgi:hypothetical protein
VRNEGLTRALWKAAERSFAVSFALEEMSQELRDLKGLVIEWRMPAGSRLFHWT